MNSSPEIEAVVDQVSQLLHRQIGLRPEPGLRGRLRRCIREDVLRRGLRLDTYLDTLLVGSESLQGLLNTITVQETAFFRHPEHFELLANEILPSLAPATTLWSAACANGQEAFSMAMLLEEGGIHGRVIATDLSTEALSRANAARYTSRELGGLSAARIARHLTREGDTWLVNSNIRDRVSIFQHNLMHPVPNQVRAAQVIFCRNVLIYFSPEHARAFLDEVADALSGAWLFLGAAETIWQLSDRFETVRSGDTFCYRRRVDAAKGEHQGAPRVAQPHDSSRGRSPRPARGTNGTAPVGKRTPRPAFPMTITPSPATTPARATTRTPSTAPAAAGTTAQALASPSATFPASDAPGILLAQAGQKAMAAGDVQAAVVAFRKCAYLTPDDPVAHLHLALALEDAGDQASAKRAYAAARHTLNQTQPADADHALEGYTTADLVRLLDSKQQVVIP